MPPPDLANPLLWAGAAGSVAFLFITLVEGWARPDYSPVRHPVSALALDGRGWIQVVNFAVSGLAIIAGGFGVILQVSGTILGLGIAVFGIGLACSAFPMDPSRGYPPGAPKGDPATPSVFHRIHDGAGAVVFFSLPAVALIAVFTLPAWWMKLNAGGMGVLLCAALHLFHKAWENESPRTGLVQRAFIVPGWLWLASVFVVGASG